MIHGVAPLDRDNLVVFNYFNAYLKSGLIRGEAFGRGGLWERWPFRRGGLIGGVLLYFVKDTDFSYIF